MSENLFVADKNKAESPFAIAKVDTVHDDGLQLIFYGESAPSQMHYKMLQTCSAGPGETVLCAKASGTYVVLGPISQSRFIRADVAERVICNDDGERLRFSVNSSKQVFISHPKYGWIRLN